MARKWTNGDSARTMTNKYNETAEEVEKLKHTEKRIEDLSEITEELLNKGNISSIPVTSLNGQDLLNLD